LDIPPLKLLDAVKHSVEDKRFFLSEQLLNVGYNYFVFKSRFPVKTPRLDFFDSLV